ncbi:hypothetical protein TRFO_22227 [Tritrichomonas foetus]|uniref:Initiator binding domain-containing protein n=1 Tax=Tritrichomonas foetus TaxID=1144522 RepID=A0A1J4KC50_9EUKA|nr:hypothetical protein TRFO_22227 [Tritrichomonas foetus]|eukprot:OHT08991.1 hypothetical protein TRFO_22227 [Tritrichomonas foetus]
MNFSTDQEEQFDWSIHGSPIITLDDSPMKFDFANQPSMLLMDAPPSDSFLLHDEDDLSLPAFPTLASKNEIKPTVLPELKNFNFNMITANYLNNYSPINNNNNTNSSIVNNNTGNLYSNSLNANSPNSNIINSIPETRSYVLPDIQVSKSPSSNQILFIMENMAKFANSKSKTEPLPPVHQIVSTEELEFESICNDKALTFNPKKLGFIPSKFWEDKTFTFGELLSNFFRRKSNSNNRFYHKLFNALKITEDDPFYSEYIGVEWVNKDVIRVDKRKFARLLGIKTIDGSLFHHQGNFPSHGFIELNTTNVTDLVSPEVLKDVDFDNVRLLIHQAGVFVKGCTEEVINDCKWINVRKGPQYYH